MIKKNSFEILDLFFKENNIEIQIENYLNDYFVESNEVEELNEDIVYSIIGDAYGAADETVKNIANVLQKNYGIYIGRIQKNQLKKYIDYQNPNDFKIFKDLIQYNEHKIINFKELIDSNIESSNYVNNRNVFIQTYLNNLKYAIIEKNESRICDYLIFLYSRLLSFNERKKISLYTIFQENEKYLQAELDETEYMKIKSLSNDIYRDDYSKIIQKYREIYKQTVEKSENKVKLVYMEIGPELFLKTKNDEHFYDCILNEIKRSYDILENHRPLIISIKNIINKNGINIKWELYSYLSIFAEKFVYQPENRPYYNPETICEDILSHKYGIILTDSEKKNLKEYYSKGVNIEFTNDDKILKTIDYFKCINTGFSFIDCFILKTSEKSNSEEVKFIKNKNELLLVFYKHKIDDQKIPCPICGSLKVSGNSYPEIGVKSWECKNPLCFERSKTNRGKRYSVRTDLMQDATFDFSCENQISKDLIKIWRKDVVEKWNDNELFEMIIKFHSLPNDEIQILSENDLTSFISIASDNRRKAYINKFNILNETKIFNYFFSEENDFMSLFLYEKTKMICDFCTIKSDDEIEIINGDAFSVLSRTKEKSIQNMITSPPYYNAREYSQWGNLYNYLNDMYNINNQAYKCLINGGIFFYNIGDIFDNENTIVKSKMGEKRIPLGAYTILLFKFCGFELLDNIIWYKGETQSNRHKNDGNCTPFYQRPANCYEHIFIFKKKGKLKLNKNKNENILNENVIKITPVFKIGKGGENRYGHTAPFPKLIPQLSVLCFTSIDDKVLDPFSGSGTTPLVAKLNNRVGIGIELHKEYCDLTIRKIKDECNQLKLGKFD